MAYLPSQSRYVSTLFAGAAVLTTPGTMGDIATGIVPNLSLWTPARATYVCRTYNAGFASGQLQLRTAPNGGGSLLSPVALELAALTGVNTVAGATISANAFTGSDVYLFQSRASSGAGTLNLAFYVENLG